MFKKWLTQRETSVYNCDLIEKQKIKALFFRGTRAAKIEHHHAPVLNRALNFFFFYKFLIRSRERETPPRQLTWETGSRPLICLCRSSRPRDFSQSQTPGRRFGASSRTPRATLLGGLWCAFISSKRAAATRSGRAAPRFTVLDNAPYRTIWHFFLGQCCCAIISKTCPCWRSLMPVLIALSVINGMLSPFRKTDTLPY